LKTAGKNRLILIIYVTVTMIPNRHSMLWGIHGIQNRTICEV